jgi:uncharacterized protein YecE (DUF72 family)
LCLREQVDSSCYAIPRASSTRKWVAAVASSPGFVFHVKAFGLFCAGSCPVSTLPCEVRETLKGFPEIGSPKSLSLQNLSKLQVCMLWDLFHAALKPLRESLKMGCVVFQFHLSFKPCAANQAHVLWCRSMLDAEVLMYDIIARRFRCCLTFYDPPARLTWLHPFVGSIYFVFPSSLAYHLSLFMNVSAYQHAVHGHVQGS